MKYDNYIYSPANIYNVHAISQYMKLTLWHHTINTALALDKFLINLPPLMSHLVRDLPTYILGLKVIPKYQNKILNFYH